MASLCKIRSVTTLRNLYRPASPFSVCSHKSYASEGGKGSSKNPTASAAKATTSDAPDVPGLSSNVLSVPNSEVGPGASKKSQYKNPEYFSYNAASYFEAEVEMLKYRCPQPSALTPSK